jgi:hypothetical protein
VRKWAWPDALTLVMTLREKVPETAHLITL